MKAMIFAAGLGTRLKPLTDDKPKALVEVGGKPLLEHTINKLKASGFDEIIINVHHFADQIVDFLKSKKNFEINIQISDEREKLLDTGGGIKKAEWFLNDGEPFLIHNVDIFSNLNLKELYAFHTQKTDVLSTLVVSQRDTFRYLLFDENQTLKGWINEKTGETKPTENLDASLYSKLAFSGIQVVSPKIFELMEKWEDKFSIIDFYLQNCSQNSVYSFVPKDYKMIDVGKIPALKEAEIFLSE